MYLHPSRTEIRIELIRDEAVSIQYVDVGPRYPPVLVIEMATTELRLGFGYEHGPHVVAWIDRLIVQLVAMRQLEARAVALAGDQNDGAVSIPD